MSTTPHTVVVQSGGHLTLQGRGSGTTAIEVEPAVPPRPQISVEPARTPTRTIVVTALATLTAAWVGQFAAHRYARTRDRHKANREQLDAAIDTWSAAADEMNTMVAAFIHAAKSKKHERMYQQALVYYAANVQARTTGRRYRSFPDADGSAVALSIGSTASVSQLSAPRPKATTSLPSAQPATRWPSTLPPRRHLSPNSRPQRPIDDGAGLRSAGDRPARIPVGVSGQSRRGGRSLSSPGPAGGADHGPASFGRRRRAPFHFG